MRIIRFVAKDGRRLYGEDHQDGSATILSNVERLVSPHVMSTAELALLKGKQALVADDDENMCRIISTVLEKAGCDCLVCRDGAEALRTIEHEALDLVVSDVVMPHHSGFEIYSAAKALHKQIPIVLITGYGYDPDHTLVKAAQAGDRSVLYKPFSAEQLINALGRAIRSSNGSLSQFLTRTDQRVDIARVLPPIECGDIICIGRNYRTGTTDSAGTDEALEVFIKPRNALTAAHKSIILPNLGDDDPRVTCEGELAVIIGARTKRIEEDEAMSVVLGFTIANDVTARRFQTTEGAPRWMRGKGFDSFCPMGPVIVTTEDMPDLAQRAIRTTINGIVVRDALLGDMLRTVPAIIAELSRNMTLEPGTTVLTGAPPLLDDADAKRSLQHGDEIVVEIEGIGRLENTVEVG